jgi:DNA-binding transcriptional ArsR family regulator
LPSSPDIDPNEEPRVVGLDSADADELIDALSSTTTRKVLAALHEEPGSASALADRVDTSLQNVQYHLGKLEDAGLVEVGDTVYSEKGREMDIYVPADGALVVVAGREEETAGLKAAVSRLLGGLGVLGVASLVVDRLARRGLRLPVGGTGGADGASGGGGDGSETGAGGGGADAGASSGGDDAAATTPTDATPSGTATAADGGEQTVAEATATPTATDATAGTPTPVAEATTTPLATETAEATPTATPMPTAVPAEATEAATTAAQPGVVDGAATSPGLVFFLGGATVLVGGFALWWLRR